MSGFVLRGRAGDVAVYERPTRTIRCVACPAAERGAASAGPPLGTRGAGGGL